MLLAALLTAIYRPMMQHAPMFCFDASDPGSGKGKLAKCVGMMALGRRPAHMNLDPRDTEFITHFSAVLLAGDPVVWIDNISRPIGGIDVLDSAITEPIRQCENSWRVGIQKLPVPCRILATGNNLVFKGDTYRRVLVCRIDSDVEKPEEKRFGFDPVKEFAANRPAHVAAVLTILRAYIVAGKPGIDELQPFGSFNDLDLVRGASFGLAKKTRASPDLTTRRLTTPKRTSRNSSASGVVCSVNRNDQCATCGPRSSTTRVELFPLVDAMKVATKQTDFKDKHDFDPRLTGRRLLKFKGKITGGLKLTSHVDPHDEIALWQVVKVAEQTLPGM